MFRSLVKRTVVTAHVVLPGVADMKGALLGVYRKALRRPREAAFECLRHLPLSDSGLMIDVGGAKGESVASMRLFSRNAPVVTFEPNPMYAAAIRRRFSRDARICVQPLALSDEEGDFPLYVPLYKYTAFPDLGTLEFEEAQNWLRSRVFGYRDENLTIAQFVCHCRRLDSFSFKPQLLKIDTRCNASKVLQGGAKMIAEYCPIIVLERVTLAPACISMMVDYGYRPFQCRTSGVRQANANEPCDLLLTDELCNTAAFRSWLDNEKSC